MLNVLTLERTNMVTHKRWFAEVGGNSGKLDSVFAWDQVERIGDERYIT